MYDYWGDVESIIIPDGVTAIEDSVFPNDIINITIPESVTNINSSAINPCGEIYNLRKSWQLCRSLCERIGRTFYCYLNLF